MPESVVDYKLSFCLILIYYIHLVSFAEMNLRKNGHGFVVASFKWYFHPPPPVAVCPQRRGAQQTPEQSGHLSPLSLLYYL